MLLAAATSLQIEFDPAPRAQTLGRNQTMHHRQKAAVRYWERRRIAYNLLLTPPAILGWSLGSAVGGAGDDHAAIGIGGILLLFIFAAICANICYTISYALEFLLLSLDDDSIILRNSRTAAFICGCVLSIPLALIGGRNIAFIQYAL